MSKGSTATTTTGPASYLTSDYENLVNQGANLYANNPPQYYPGNQVAPFSPLQEQGFGDIQSAASAPNSLGSSADSYFNSLENGSLLNPATNPSLQGMTQLADQQIQNNLSSEFAGSGRNIEGSAPIQASQMGSVASQIYGGAYNNTLNNMTSALPQASQLTTQQYIPGSELLGAGGQIQGQAQNMIGANQNEYAYDQQLPYQQLSGFGNLLQGIPGSTQTTPYYQNVGSGILGGGIGGADIGSIIGNLISGQSGASTGAGIGGGLGALLGGLV
jgi:hypothetical protein